MSYLPVFTVLNLERSKVYVTQLYIHFYCFFSLLYFRYKFVDKQGSKYVNHSVAEADQALYYCLRVVFLEPRLHQLLVLVPKANIMFAPFFFFPDSQVD